MSRTDQALRQLAFIRSELDKLTKQTLTEIERRGRYTTRPDGYPSRTINEGGHTTNELTGVEAVANQRGFAGTDDDYLGRCTVGHPQPDPTGDAIRELFEAITKAAAAFGTIADRRRYVAGVQYRADRKPPTGAGTCGCCHRDVPGTDTDRLRSGYCDACRKAWERAGRPDRLLFEIERRASLEAGDTQIPTSDHQSTNLSPAGGTVNANVAAVGRDAAPHAMTPEYAE